MITHEDITELKKVFDERYVLQSDCNEKQEQVSKKFANDDKRLELISLEHRQTRAEMKNGLKFNNWLTAGTLIAIIGGVVAYYFVR